jgi:hypothetical protein
VESNVDEVSNPNEEIGPFLDCVILYQEARDLEIKYL